MSTRNFRLFSLLLFSLFIAFIPSCKQKWDYTKEIVQLDSTSTILQSLEKNLLAIDTGYLRSSFDSAAHYLSTIKEKCFNDTVQKNTAIFLSDVYECSGNICYVLDSSKWLEKIINESIQRVNNLKYDLAQNLIEKNNAKEYVAYELKAANKMSESIVRAIEKANVCCVKLDSMKTQIIFMADSLQSALKER